MPSARSRFRRRPVMNRLVIGRVERSIGGASNANTATLIPLTFSAATDDNDLGYYLGTKALTEAYSVPSAAAHGWLGLRSNGFADSARKASRLLERNTTTHFHSADIGAVQRTMNFDLPCGMRMRVDKFAMLNNDLNTPNYVGFTVQGSNDLDTWTDLVTVTNAGFSGASQWKTWDSVSVLYFQYLRVFVSSAQTGSQGNHYVAASQVKFWGMLEESDITAWAFPPPKPTFGASGILRTGPVTPTVTGGTHSGTAAQTYDSSGATRWHSAGAAGGMAYQVPAAFYPREIHFMSRGDAANAVFLGAKLRGSLDGSTWVDVETWPNSALGYPNFWGDDTNWPANTTMRIPVVTATAYPHWQVLETGGTYMIIAECEMYGHY